MKAFNLQGMVQRFSTLRGARLMLVILAMSGVQLFFNAVLAIPWGGLVEASCRWDCTWYVGIAQNGYMPLSTETVYNAGAQKNWAFFPLYPIISSLVSWGLGIKVITSGLLVNILLWPVIVLLCCKDMELRGIEVNNLLFCLFFIVYPLNIWYYSQYSEAVYGVLLMGMLVSLRLYKLYLACILGFFLSISRPTGFLMVICLAAWWFFTARQPEDRSMQERTMLDRLREAALLVSVAGAGLSAFVLYFYDLIGDGFAFAHVEKAWGRHFLFFPQHILIALESADRKIFGVYAIYVMVLLFLMWRKKWMVNALLLSTTAFVGASTGVVAIERHILANPLAIEFLAYLTVKLPYRETRNILVGLGAGHVCFVLIWYMNTFFLT
ncbi:hypothetical protein [Acetobacter sp. LMG 32666]|uniref:hypothetical protein n=1 Tax=Acetobacter sp. LMG 32666 TaxID=2959295 RepID=UPI0030C858DB